MRSLSIASKPDLHPAFAAIYTNISTKKQLYAIIEQMYLNDNCFWGLCLLQYTH
jgi:hypothetical protein